MLTIKVHLVEFAQHWRQDSWDGELSERKTSAPSFVKKTMMGGISVTVRLGGALIVRLAAGLKRSQGTTRRCVAELLKASTFNSRFVAQS